MSGQAQTSVTVVELTMIEQEETADQKESGSYRFSNISARSTCGSKSESKKRVNSRGRDKAKQMGPRGQAEGWGKTVRSH